jgi:3-dehydroquinate synthase
MTHGEAISIGMIIEGKIALNLGVLDRGDFERLVILLRKAGLPTRLSKRPDLRMMIDTMKLDKKARDGNIEMVLPSKIGEMSDSEGKFGIKIEEDLIYNSLEQI